MISACSRKVRAVMLFTGIALLGQIAPVRAGQAPFQARTEANEPFPGGVLLPSGGGPLEKWLAVLRRWKDEKRTVAACRNGSSQCSAPGSRRFVEMVDAAKVLTGRAQLGEVNRAVNLAISPASDLATHGLVDVWSSPLATLANGSGDCEDYAILKFAVLLEAGVAPENVRLMIVRDSVRYEDHAIVAVRYEDQWLTLDNRRMPMLADTELASYTPLLLLDYAGARRYLNISVALPERKVALAPSVTAKQVDYDSIDAQAGGCLGCHIAVN
jgi:predicted transglutaminase-like cysteine proteinase